MTDAADAAQVAARVRVEADERRQRGEYPEGLEAHLDRHYHAIVREDRGRLAERLREEAGRLAANVELAWQAVAADSRLPGGSAFHRAVAASVERQVGPLIEQLREFTRAVAAVLELEAQALGELRGHVDGVVEHLADSEDARAP